MKKIQILAVVIGFIIVAAMVLGAVYYLGNRYLTSGSPAANAVACSGRHPTHTVTIQHDAASPRHTRAALCDTLTITNADDEPRLIAFGLHEHHQPYDGITERLLGKDQSLTISLNQAGTYRFHDHIHDEVMGDFTVVK
jgi:hypothetical protein